MEFIRRSGLLIPREYQYEDFYVTIKEFLTRRTKAYNTSNFILNTFYVESEKYLLIPRYFPVDNYTSGFSIRDVSQEGQDIDITHSITPRSEAQEKAMNHTLSNDQATLQLAPGVGKTVISIYTLAERKKKSLILVHTKGLAEQWVERVKQFTNVTDDDIGRLSSTTFEDDLDKPVIISLVQTFVSLLKRNPKDFLIKLNNAHVGMFIADEVHTSVGAPTFSQCSIQVPSKYTYGLSATPYRYDGNGDILEFHLGDIFADADIKGTMDAKVNVILLDFEIDTPQRHTYVRWGGDFQRARYLNLIKKSKNFNEVMDGLLKLLKDRDVICIAERIKLIDELYKMSPSLSKAKFCGKGELETLQSKITFATPGKCRDGIDAPWKDTLIMTSPISNIEQLAGRVTRSSPNKDTPLLVDLVDSGCKNISNTFYKREEYYEQKKWPVQYYVYVANKLNKIEKSVAHQILRGE